MHAFFGGRVGHFKTVVISWFLAVLAFNLLAAPVAPRGAYGCGSSRCILWFHIQLALPTCHVHYHTELWDSRALDCSDS